MIEFDEFHCIELTQLFELLCCFLDMRANNDEPAIRVARHNELITPKQRFVRNAADDLCPCRCCTKEKVLSLLHRTYHSNRKHFYIHIIYGVHDDLAKICHCHELLYDHVHTHSTQVIERDADNIGRTECALRLFLDVLLHIGRRITKGLIPCKLRIPCRCQLRPLLYVVDIADGKAPALLEERHKHLAVNAFARLLKGMGERRRLKRIVPAQGRVAAADEHERLTRSLCFRRHALGNLPMLRPRLGRLERTRIREDKKHRIFLGKARSDTLLRPVRIDVDAVHRLHARRVVIEHDDLAVKARAFVRKRSVDGRLVHGRNLREQCFLRYLHGSPPHKSLDLTTTPEMFS